MKYWLAESLWYEVGRDTLPERVAAVPEWWLGTTSALGGQTQPFFYLTGFFTAVLPATWTQADVDDYAVLYDSYIVEVNVTEDEYEGIMDRMLKIATPLGTLAEEAQAGAPLL